MSYIHANLLKKIYDKTILSYMHIYTYQCLLLSTLTQSHRLSPIPTHPLWSTSTLNQNHPPWPSAIYFPLNEPTLPTLIYFHPFFTNTSAHPATLSLSHPSQTTTTHLNLSYPLSLILTHYGSLLSIFL